jgi:uncharacterized protein (TIGR03067 family)
MRIIKTFFRFYLLAALISPVHAGDSDAVKKDLDFLQGEWTMVSGSADGQPMPEDIRKEMKRVCKGDEITVTMGDQVFLKAKVTLDPSKKPKTIDYKMTDGFTKGKTQLGIYELEGDTIKACFGSPGSERPTAFSGKPGEGHTMSVWKKVKPSGTKPVEKAAQ